MPWRPLTRPVVGLYPTIRDRSRKMPKMKTKSGAKKRFKFSATGKLKHGQAYNSHRLISTSQRTLPDSWPHLQPIYQRASEGGNGDRPEGFGRSRRQGARVLQGSGGADWPRAGLTHALHSIPSEPARPWHQASAMIEAVNERE